jgi:hypothetical protein
VPAPEQPLTDIELLTIIRLDDKPMEARVDTGAKFCSLHADDVQDEGDWVKFTRGDVTYKVARDRDIKIRSALGKHARLIVKLDVEVRGKRYNGIEFTIVDREHMKYEALIGRNLLELIGLPVIVSTTTADEPADAADIGLDQEEE